MALIFDLPTHIGLFVNDANDGKPVVVVTIDDQVPTASPAAIDAPAMFEHPSQSRQLGQLIERVLELAFIALGLIDPPSTRGKQPNIAKVLERAFGENYPARNCFLASAKACCGLRSLRPLSSPTSISVRK